MHPQPGCKVMTREQLNEGDINSVVAGASLLPAAGTLYLLAEVTATVSFSLTIKIGEGSNWDMETGILTLLAERSKPFDTVSRPLRFQAAIVPPGTAEADGFEVMRSRCDRVSRG